MKHRRRRRLHTATATLARDASLLRSSSIISTGNQTTLELPTFGELLQDLSMKILVEKTEDSIMVNRRQSPTSTVVADRTTSTVATDSSSVYAVKSSATAAWLNNKKHDDLEIISFPVSKQYRSCCSTVQRLCCHKLLSTNKHILRKEREQLQLHMQPVEEEEMETKTDKHVEYAVDCLMGLLMKRPKSCCGCCESHWKHFVAVWGYRCYQLLILFYFIYVLVFFGIGDVLCVDSSFFRATTGKSFRCPAVQKQLKLSNFTKHSNGYAGMIDTMKALEESNLQRWPGAKYSVVFNTSDIDPETGYPYTYEEFLWWRANTSSIVPFLVWACHDSCYVLVAGSIFLLFGMRDGLTEIMFPPLLEDMDQEENAGEVEPDMEIGNNKELVHSHRFHFVRPKRFVLQASLWITVAMVLFPNPQFFDNFNSWVVTVLLAVPIGPLGSIAITGLCIQIHNATTLSNILVQLCSMETLLPEQQQAQFEQWKHYYKTAVGALHIWSRRVSPLSSSLLLWLIVNIILYLVQSIFQYTHVMSEPDIPESKRMEIFLKMSDFQISFLFLVTFLFLFGTSMAAMVSFRYKRLNLLVATLCLPTHQLDDFEILQKQNAAFTVYDIPIISNTVMSIMYLLFIQTFVVALTMAGS